MNFPSRGKKQRLTPVVVQDYATRELLMVAYANASALKETVRTGFANYWSRSRNELSKKGQTGIPHVWDVDRFSYLVCACERAAEQGCEYVR